MTEDATFPLGRKLGLATEVHATAYRLNAVAHLGTGSRVEVAEGRGGPIVEASR